MRISKIGILFLASQLAFGAGYVFAGQPQPNTLKVGDVAGGDLGGTYPNPSVKKINGAALGSTTPTGGNLLVGNGSAWQSTGVSGDATLSSSGNLTISNGAVNSDKLNATGVTAASYKNADITVGADGRITSATDGDSFLDSDGHVKLSGSTSTPTTDGVCSVSGTDNLGDVNSFDGNHVDCSIFFNVPYQVAPICIISPSTGDGVSIATGTLGFLIIKNSGLFGTTDHVFYHCFAR